MGKIHEIPRFNISLRTSIKSMFNTRWLDFEFELTLLVFLGKLPAVHSSLPGWGLPLRLGYWGDLHVCRYMDVYSLLGIAALFATFGRSRFIDLGIFASPGTLERPAKLFPNRVIFSWNADYRVTNQAIVRRFIGYRRRCWRQICGFRPFE